ncbi:3-keto-L-gulonate-6-phosphate decarboxylase UlaD [Thorsellia anophelis]|uniref:3-dehydro-L-gulonate-6-phosphate decarboxylase n=1 Tax=Thorsellia anophelis DSM 18579 TaxID=1123402 RepID=A0A1I0B8H4_9GAMM|nr:3-keto-L-gulonate-6-phosphate decarboxylase UlaD [Thorsellia anophelis]SET03084.1 3-dehydro-L-gulonate-6-phosphate decarboxylase [Thorsellia anophelis DSM 18579]
MKPLLQIALDQIEQDDALEVAKLTHQFVDIIEVGTILAFSNGVRIVRTLRDLYPTHTLVCDLKTTDGGAILSKMAFEAGTDWLTVSAAAHIATINACKLQADKYGGELQIEIYGNWTFEEVAAWRNLGITQCIYHRSRDAELAGLGWLDADIEKMKKLSDYGIAVSITGGIVSEDIHLFKEVNAKCFIVGRALATQGGDGVAKAIRQEIDKYWL